MATAAERVKAPSESDAFALIRLDREMKYCQECKGLAKDLQFLPVKKYENWSKMSSEIGRMIGGWLKSA
ncbi:four helix bundle protein, partial [Acetomicrobium sp. S15 = DSM 107314]|uniref:four helix bundle protein n=1 Tax=Acetomicrobium sp. S15 = DSM 107314 TaxID=2529858 RepID=UPI001E3B8551